MAAGLGNAQRRGRGRGRGGAERLPGGNLPRGGGMPLNKNSQNPQGNGGVTAPAGRGNRGQGVGQGRPGQGKMGIGGGALPGPGGRQLAARVSSGAITQEQAQKTMQQRQTLAKAFGSGWREKVSASAGGKSFAEVNAGLKKNPKDPKLAAIRKKLLAGRKELLTTARAKNKGGEGEESED